MADIYFTRVTKDVESSFSLSPRQMALWQSEREEHTFDWLRVVPIYGLGPTMNGKTYHCVLCYRLGVPLFSVSKPCSACSKVFTGDVYGDHAVSCAGVIGIKHRHNTVRDTFIDICVSTGLLSGKELADFVPGRVVIDAIQRKRGKYRTKCADIGYGFLPFSFSSFGELEKDAVTLLKREHQEKGCVLHLKPAQIDEVKEFLGLITYYEEEKRYATKSNQFVWQTDMARRRQRLGAMASRSHDIHHCNRLDKSSECSREITKIFKERIDDARYTWTKVSQPTSEEDGDK
ncbi:hypothetical protein Tco_1111404 [Tanacetum coccineum]|uniref:Uncharacterized protein n=1 Tax=Tanacetum coccineum TaxID=301880 RepID=A0ABQ5ILY3_9ASTR